MPMTVIVTRDVAPRFRGFLASCMVEIAPGVYTAPNMTQSVRERVWTVLSDWYAELGGGAIIMTWRAPSEPGHQGLQTLGLPPRSLCAVDGLYLVKRDYPDQKNTQKNLDS